MIGNFKGEDLDKHYVCSSKAFLQPNNWKEGGSLQWHVLGYSEKEGISMKAEVQFSDCYKHVYLDFDCDTQDDFHARMDKIKKMIEELNQFRLAMIEARRHTLRLHEERVEKNLFKEEEKEDVRDCNSDLDNNPGDVCDSREP